NPSMGARSATSLLQSVPNTPMRASLRSSLVCRSLSGFAEKLLEGLRTLISISPTLAEHK
ncbi:MAG TPA: hypothetical protein VMH83_09640, partial [Candidatus Acidoferrum sp.]|nr:hypothetical protein [Candidatus Acidoferrum sp.]